MDEAKLGEQMARASRAAQLINDEIFAEAIDGLRAQLMARWLISPDCDERERIWMSVHLVEQIRQALVTMISNGNLAQRQLEELIAMPRPNYNA